MTPFSSIVRPKSLLSVAPVAGVSVEREGKVDAATLQQLQDELRDTAAGLDRHGRHDAADLAVTLAARLGELIDASRGLGRAARESAS